jgi:hypothetical protein
MALSHIACKAERSLDFALKRHPAAKIENLCAVDFPVRRRFLKQAGFIACQ